MSWGYAYPIINLWVYPTGQGKLSYPHRSLMVNTTMSTLHPAPGGKAIASAHPLTYQAPRSAGSTGSIDEVDDFLCWTVIGIGKILYTPLLSKC